MAHLSCRFKRMLERRVAVGSFNDDQSRNVSRYFRAIIAEPRTSAPGSLSRKSRCAPRMCERNVRSRASAKPAPQRGEQIEEVNIHALPTDRLLFFGLEHAQRRCLR